MTKAASSAQFPKKTIINHLSRVQNVNSLILNRKMSAAPDGVAQLGPSMCYVLRFAFCTLRSQHVYFVTIFAFFSILIVQKHRQLYVSKNVQKVIVCTKRWDCSEVVFFALHQYLKKKKKGKNTKKVTTNAREKLSRTQNNNNKTKTHACCLIAKPIFNIIVSDSDHIFETNVNILIA